MSDLDRAWTLSKRAWREPGKALDTAFAMLRVLQTAFVIAFQGRFTLGALVTFLVTVAGIPVLNIGAPFWALIGGALVSLLLERDDWASRAEPPGHAPVADVS